MCFVFYSDAPDRFLWKIINRFDSHPSMADGRWNQVTIISIFNKLLHVNDPDALKITIPYRPEVFLIALNHMCKISLGDIPVNGCNVCRINVLFL